MWQGACLVVAAMLLSTPVALSQGSVGGRVSGRVTDPDGAVVPGASISAQNTNTNVVNKSQSNDSGYYVMQLPEGKYNITVSAAGFSTIVEQAVPITVGGDAGLDVHLIIATTSTAVEVTGAASAELMTPNSAEVQTTVDNEMVQAIPVECLRNAAQCERLPQARARLQRDFLKRRSGE